VVGEQMEEDAGEPAGVDALAEEDGLAIRPSKYRDMQVARVGKRKLFDKARRKVFLEWLAATGNCVFAAAKAGVNYKTVWKHRMKDPRFAEAFDRALDQGVARAKARLIEDKPKQPIDIDGDLDAVEFEPADPELVLKLVREHERHKAGVPRRQQRTRARIASNKEVEEALRKRIRAFVKRERAMRRILRDGSSPSSAPPRDRQ
jgi:hypothetical protein